MTSCPQRLQSKEHLDKRVRGDKSGGYDTNSCIVIIVVNCEKCHAEQTPMVLSFLDEIKICDEYL